MRVGSTIRVRGAELGEVEVVVEDLTGIVEDAAFGLLHNFLQRHRLERRAGNELVEVVHVALEVLAVVEFEGLGADHGRQSVDFVGEGDYIHLFTVYCLLFSLRFKV